MNENKRFFQVTITEQWSESMLDYRYGENHSEVAANMHYLNKRITNQRFREIEKTGRYYRITENKKGGKSFIFEID